MAKKQLTKKTAQNKLRKLMKHIKKNGITGNDVMIARNKYKTAGAQS